MIEHLAHATRAELKQQLRQFGQPNVTTLVDTLHTLHGKGQGKHISLSLLLAVGSVETDLRNIATDGGHGRGVFQQDDRDSDNRRFLRFHRGCPSGSYKWVYLSALPAGRVPTLASGAKRCVQDIDAHRRYVRAMESRIPDKELTACSLASYNAGPAGAVNGWRRGYVDLNTATGDYSTRVFARASIFHDLLV